MKYIFIIVAIIILIGVGFYFLRPESFSPPQDNVPGINSRSSNNNQEALSVVAEDLDTPWSIVFLPDESILVTQRNGEVLKISNGNKEQVAVIENAREYSEGGLMGMALHPEFESNNYIYFYYTYQESGDNTLNRVTRMTYNNGSLSNEEIIVDRIPGGIFHDGGRIKFGPDDLLYITTGDATQPSLSQNRSSLAGKILRVDDEGNAAEGNPFNSRIYSYGHRNPQGITWDDSGNLWSTEHGPSGVWPNCCRDEINKIMPGQNYGWPDSSGDSIEEGTTGPELHSGSDVWAPGSAAFYNGSIFFGGLRGQALYQYKIESGELFTHFKNRFGRIREVIVGPDNLLYITTSNLDGRGRASQGDDKIIRVNPEKL
jgi:aldose sugar dehydrogenase